MKRSYEEEYSESYSSVREQGIEICCVYSSSLKKRVVHFVVFLFVRLLPCSVV